MIDLSITKDSEWLKQRNVVWQKLEEGFKEGLRKKELNELKDYFFTGIYSGKSEFPDLAFFKWFPLQTFEGWDYVFEYLVKDSKSYERCFYHSFSDLSIDGLTDQQEFDLWDYFAGNEFKSVITSRVPVGPNKTIVSFEVRLESIAKVFSLNFGSWLRGLYSDAPKWVRRSSYCLSFLRDSQSVLFARDENGGFKNKGAKNIEYLFEDICLPPYGEYNQLVGESLKARENFVCFMFDAIDSMEKIPELKALWEEVKNRRN